MHHPMPLSKTGWPILNVVLDFGYINSWAVGHLMLAGWVHHSRSFGHAEAVHEVGPKMSECGWKTSVVPVVWATFGIFSVMCNSDDFLTWLVTMDKTCLNHYDLETMQQSMEWRHSGPPRPAPKNLEYKIRQKSSHLNFLGSRLHPPRWLYS